jgi:hypothetical protein
MPQDNFIIGYGSLLSAYSRQTFSDIHHPAISVTAHGWRRGWSTRDSDEGATYASVRPDPDSSLVAALLPTEITAKLRHRERSYEFVEVSPDTLTTREGSSIPGGRFWIVVNREYNRAQAKHPIPQSYVDTCLIGCMELGGETMMRAFINQTEHWNSYWINDREWTQPLYPRRAPLTVEQAIFIDAVLDVEQVGKLRKSKPNNLNQY